MPSNADLTTDVHVRCLCGDVRLTASPPLVSAGHCHCDHCRWTHGAAMWTWVTFERDRLVPEPGSAPLTDYLSVSGATRSFCGRCGSSLTYRHPDAPEEVDVALANVVEDLRPRFVAHCWAHRAAAWNSLPDDGLPRRRAGSSSETIEAD